jgi:hypothetical protein
MPVRLTAYNSLQPLFAEDDEQLAELRRQMYVVKDPNIVALSKHPVFPDRADYQPSGFFRNNGDAMTKDFGTYSNWQAFKSGLATKFMGKTIEEIFEEPTPGPFFELLYFSDVGTNWMIGPKTAEKLARDFADNRGQAETVGGSFFQQFAALQKLFEHASRSGAVAVTAT